MKPVINLFGFVFYDLFFKPRVVNKKYWSLKWKVIGTTMNFALSLFISGFYLLFLLRSSDISGENFILFGQLIFLSATFTFLSTIHISEQVFLSIAESKLNN